MNPGPHCRSCGAPIRWVVTEKGKTMPIDELGSDQGNVVRTGEHEMDGRERVLVFHTAEAAIYACLVGENPRPRHLSHFATCPNAATHRRKK